MGSSGSSYEVGDENERSGRPTTEDTDFVKKSMFGKKSYNTGAGRLIWGEGIKTKKGEKNLDRDMIDEEEDAKSYTFKPVSGGEARSTRQQTTVSA